MKKVLITILKVVVLILILLWIIMVFVDYFRVKNGDKPLYCLSEQVKEYTDGSNKICNGFGYKTITYDRECLKATEFGPFFIQERQCD